MKRAQSIIDPNNYYVSCAGIRYPFEPEPLAIARAQSLKQEWAELGYKRTVKVFFQPTGKEVLEL